MRWDRLVLIVRDDGSAAPFAHARTGDERIRSDSRVVHYRRADPGTRFLRDHDDMLDERGLALAPVPPADRAILRAHLTRTGVP